MLGLSNLQLSVRERCHERSSGDVQEGCAGREERVRRDAVAGPRVARRLRDGPHRSLQGRLRAGVVAPVDEVARQDLVLVEEDELRRAVGLVAEVRVVARLLAQAAVAAEQRPVLASGQGEAREDDGVPRVREGEARVGRRVDPKLTLV